MKSIVGTILALAATVAANVNNATYDGQCCYPVGDPNFPSDNLVEYTGRWYQVAGTFATFTLGCTCISADYGLGVSIAPSESADRPLLHHD
jgi:apolipoprotein D and lipocalin family protein